jgi:hypothetical protein
MVCKIINLSVPKLGVLCALAGINPRVRVFQINAKFARAAQNLSYSSTKVTKGSDIFDQNFVLFVSFVVKSAFSFLVAALPR